MERIERTVPSFRWCRAFRVIMLVLAILQLLSVVLGVVAMTFFSMAALHESPPPELVTLLEAIKVLAYQCVALYAVTGIFFLVIYFALRARSRAGIVLVLALNVWLPVSNLLMIPMITRYFRVFTSTISEFSGGSLVNELSMFSVMINTVVPISCVVSAIIIAAILVPNSIYFHKRRDFIHLENVSM